ncbi:sister chromatid cohesion acetyltransferase-like protein Eco1 [Phyllosticta citriasiana]|uniref:sister chromatid cohesion acetyltransferase-like protein Eco1 n=1 Tax=Phyllosticta citriasiana TaxID=595635 RepID=UPI0030FD59A0
MALKTYSRQRKTSQPTYEPPSKRRRIASPDAPSFSDDAPTSENTAPAPAEPSSPLLQSQSYENVPELALPSSTPPSSPPAPTRTSPSPVLLKRRPAFSFLARKPRKSESSTAKQSTGAPLQPRSPNDVTAGRKAKNGATKKQTRLTQLQLDLGTAPVQKTCSTCGMAYVPSNSEDAALHKVFHAQNVGGVELGRGFVRGLTAAQRVWEGLEGDCVVVVSRRDGAAAKNRVARVMEVVRAELGAVEIAEAELWSQGGDSAKDPKTTEPPTPTTTTCPSQAPTTADRYKAYLYIRGTKCVGLCLAERISSAFHHDDINPSTNGPTNPSPSTSQTPVPTPIPIPMPSNLGISRIWTSTSHRGAGIARRLLAVAARHFVYGAPVPRAAVAFSQPTQMGLRLARGWVGDEARVLVYW